MVTSANDIYRAFYTKSEIIVTYMVSRLLVDSKMKVLEPCAGDGVFIDALLRTAPDIPIDAYELNPKTAELLKNKYWSNPNINITLDDTLTSQELNYFYDESAIYDRIIANPPYGGWLDYDKRKYLKRLYPSIYSKETYTLFLYRCIKLLKDRGILVFIIPDTFLNLHMHTQLRKFLLTNTKIIEISLFPSSFFPNVNFGYSNLCIISLQRCCSVNECLNHEVRIIPGLKNLTDLSHLQEMQENHHRAFMLKQNDIYQNINHSFLICDNPKVSNLIAHHTIRIRDIADCVTGFYSGNDKRYLHPISIKVRNDKKYEPIDAALICNDYTGRKDILNGITDSAHFIPIVKGGGTKYYKADIWYMDWSTEAVREYKTSKKARFQNTQYYFRTGIAVPMVTSSQITAALIERRLFDQSIVGVFPRDMKLLYYLLGFFNSTACNKLIRTINRTANNPANYIKEIPFIIPSEGVLSEITEIIQGFIRCLKEGKGYSLTLEDRINELITETYGI